MILGCLAGIQVIIWRLLLIIECVIFEGLWLSDESLGNLLTVLSRQFLSLHSYYHSSCWQVVEYVQDCVSSYCLPWKVIRSVEKDAHITETIIHYYFIFLSKLLEIESIDIGRLVLNKSLLRGIFLSILSSKEFFINTGIRHFFDSLK